MDPTPKEAAEMLKKGGKKGGKNKPKVMHLSEFQNSGTSGSSSWADDVDADLPSGPKASDLPTGPNPNYDPDSGDYRNRRSNYGDDRSDRSSSQRDREYTRRDDGPREDRQARPRGDLIERRGYQIDTSARPHKTTFPTSAPFKLYLGNLNFRTTHDEITKLLNGCKVLDIKIPEVDGRSRGFAYVEVDSIEALHRGLEMNGAIVQDRTVIIDLADVPNTEQRDWRQREGGAEAIQSRYNRDREGRDNRDRDGRGPREYNRDYNRDRDNRDFNRDRDNREERQERQPRFSKSDDIGDWRIRSENPVPLVQRENRDRDRDRFAGDRKPSYNRGDQERSNGDFVEPSSSSSGERRKLELKPRSEGAAAAAAGDRPQKANPFGNAKPRDENAALREVEERRKARENASAAAGNA